MLIERCIEQKGEGETGWKETGLDRMNDLKGNITTLTDTVNNLTQIYVYDDLDRLVSAMGPGNLPCSQGYTYDRIGNITSKSDVGSYAYTYNSKPHAVRTAGSITLQYDANGNMTQRADSGTGITLDFTWNEDNKPSLIKRNTVDYIRLTYDGNGERVRKENLSTGAVTRYYGDIYEERGAINVIHIFANNRRIVSIRSDNYLQYDHGNHLGSASVITDAYGNQKETIEYFPFGTYRIRTDYDPNFPNVNYTFTDQEDDDETGLYNFKARLYDSTLGRFISADSIVPQPVNLQAFNRYSYCVNNPLVYVDPSGHWFIIDDLITACAGAVIGAVSAAISGGNILQGAAIGAAAGWVGWNTFGVASGALESVITNSLGYCSAGTLAASQFGGAVAAGITGGMVAGGMVAAFNGGNIGQGMLTGAMYGAISGAIIGGIGCVAHPFFQYAEGLSSGVTESIPNAQICFTEPDWIEASYNSLKILDPENAYVFGHSSGETMCGFSPEKLAGEISGIVRNKNYTYLVGCRTASVAEKLSNMAQFINKSVCGTTERIWLFDLQSGHFTPRPVMFNLPGGLAIPNPFSNGEWKCYRNGNAIPTVLPAR